VGGFQRLGQNRREGAELLKAGLAVPYEGEAKGEPPR
jgi:hypothetical protein